MKRIFVVTVLAFSVLAAGCGGGGDGTTIAYTWNNPDFNRSLNVAAVRECLSASDVDTCVERFTRSEFSKRWPKERARVLRQQCAKNNADSVKLTWEDWDGGKTTATYDC